MELKSESLSAEARPVLSGSKNREGKMLNPDSLFE